MKETEKQQNMADRLADEAKRIAQSIGTMQEERAAVLQRADMLMAEILRAQGALDAVKSLAEVDDEKIE